MLPPSHSVTKPRQGCLAVQHFERQFDSFAAFRPELLGMMQTRRYVPDYVEAIRQLGIIEPFTERHYRSEEVLISSQNYREELVAEG